MTPGLFAGLLLLSVPAAAQTGRRVADGVYLLDGGSGWIDLGADVLAIAGGRGDASADLAARIAGAAGKPVRATFAPNGRGGAAGWLVPATRGGAGSGLGFHGAMILGGARTAEVRELERAVSAGNGVVWLPGARLLFAGDLVGDGPLPDSSRTEAWVAVLERLRRLEPAIVVAGNGAIGGVELITRRRDALTAARASVQQGLDAHRPEADILGSVPAATADPALVRSIYRELAGLVPPAMIEELELRPGPSPTAQTPGWTRPKVVVVEEQWLERPGRAAELARVAPGVAIRISRSRAETAALMADADALFGPPSADIIARGARLRWIQSPSAGVESVARIPGFVEGPILLSNAQRIYGPPISEHVFGLLLALARRIPLAMRLGQESRWATDQFPALEMPELHGRTLLIAGLGGLGTEVARTARGFGMRVIGTRNVKGEPNEVAEYIGGADELATLAKEADFVVNTLPLTPATRNAFGAAVFGAMKPTAYFVNVGRGGTVDTDALVEALKARRIAAAGLDVTDPEPLPKGHVLWTMPNVIITPHVASSSIMERERLWLLWRENLRRFVAGEPLLAVVDKRAGY